MATRRDVAAEARNHFNNFSKFRAAFAAPSNLTSKDGWLYWLQGSPAPALYGLDLTTTDGALQPRNVLAAEARKTKLSKEEELLAQRLRARTTGGVSSYKVINKDTIFFGANGTYSVMLNGDQFDLFAEDLVEGKPQGALMDFQHNPANATGQIAFTCNNNLFVLDITLDESTTAVIKTKVTQITTIGHEELPNAVADYIIQEEFERLTGYAWSPDGERILYTVTDTSNARALTLVNSENEGEKLRFSRVGDDNAIPVFVLAELKDLSTRSVLTQQGMANIFCGAPGSTAKGGPEYTPRFGWVNKTHFYLQFLDRCQETTATYALNVQEDGLFSKISSESALVEHPTKDQFFKLSLEAATFPAVGGVTLMWKNHVPEAWIDVTQNPIIFQNSSSFASSSAAPDTTSTRYSAMYISRDDISTAGGWQQIFVDSFDLADPSYHNSSQITKQKSSVMNGSLHFDPESGKVTYKGSTDDVLQRKVLQFELNYDATAAIAGETVLLSGKNQHVDGYTVITQKKGSDDGTSSSSSSTQQYSAAFVAHEDNEVQDLFLSTISTSGGDGSSSTSSTPPRGVDLDWFAFREEAKTLAKPKTIMFQNRHGHNLSAHVFFPKSASRSTQEEKEEKKLPMMMYVYGGPHPHLIHRGSFMCRVDPLRNTLLELGYAVAVVDGRMAHFANGQNVHKSCKLAMGSFETNDWCDAVDHLTQTFPVLDPARVGIYGWSYGGYATLLAMAEAPHVFKIGASGAPVGDWRLYDTGYTERYMGLLSDPKAAEAYERSTIAAVAKGFPLELDRLIIAHGLLDENVHFSHTCHVLDAMVKHMKPYRLLAYPGQRHSMGADSQAHYMSMLCQAIVQYL